MLEQTFSMLKPDAVSRNLIGTIISVLEKQGYKIIDIRMHIFDYYAAQDFYWEHHSKGFFEQMINNICSGPTVLLLLEKDNAISDLRKLVGNTNPEDAEVGTIRCDFGIDIDNNTIHASDSQRAAKREINFFFGMNNNMLSEYIDV